MGSRNIRLKSSLLKDLYDDLESGRNPIELSKIKCCYQIANPAKVMLSDQDRRGQGKIGYIGQFRNTSREIPRPAGESAGLRDDHFETRGKLDPLLKNWRVGGRPLGSSFSRPPPRASATRLM